MSYYDVTVPCPHTLSNGDECTGTIPREVCVTGGFTPATRSDPADYPEIEYAVPRYCVHGRFPEPLSDEERVALDVTIKEAALAAVANDHDGEPSWA